MMMMITDKGKDKNKDKDKDTDTDTDTTYTSLVGILITKIVRDKKSHKTLEGILTAKMSRNTWVGIFMPKLSS